MKAEVGRFSQLGYLVLYRSFGEFKYESTRMYLGTFWWLLEPLLDLAIYYTVFGLFFQYGGPEFIPFLLCGIVPWRLYSQGLTSISTAVLGNIHLINQFPVPKIVFPLISLVKNLYQFSFALLLLLFLLAIIGNGPTATWLYTPLVLVVYLLALLGIALPLSAVMPFIPDLQKSLPHFLRVVFFMSGILYNVETLPLRFQNLLKLNPFVNLIALWRDVLIYERPPNWTFVICITLFSCCGVLLGYLLLYHFGGTYAKRVPQ